MKILFLSLMAFLPLTAMAANSIIVSGDSNVVINGKTYSGRNITVDGNNVVVDGKHQDGSLSGPVSIVVNGNAEMVKTSSGSVQVMGSVGQVETMSGNVRTKGDILGSVNTMSGSIEARDIRGKARSVSGNVTQGE